jgi:5'-methylthioadenosine phosphorylase
VVAAEVAVIGGSGFYRLLDNATVVNPDTPYGVPSGPITVGDLGGRTVAFVPRHGLNHEWAPHRINNRANLWALRELGVRRIIAPCASGSLRPDVGPGDLVVLDQLLDRTWGRQDTFLEGDSVVHVSFADPYCADLRAAALSVRDGWPGVVHDAGTVVVVQGPRFSTRAESKWYAEAGIDVINMTQYPEAYLARELGICYCGLALVTDRDVGTLGEPGDQPVTMAAAMKVLADNVDHVRELLSRLVAALPATFECRCWDERAVR